MSTLLVSGLLVVGHTFSKLVNFECFGMCWNILECVESVGMCWVHWNMLECVGSIGICWNGLECVGWLLVVTLFRSGRISSVYIVCCGLLVVGHTFSKLVNLSVLECWSVLVC